MSSQRTKKRIKRQKYKDAKKNGFYKASFYETKYEKTRYKKHIIIPKIYKEKHKNKERERMK